MGCNSSYTVSTNLDKDNFSHYFSPSKVKVYQNEQEFTQAYQFIGLVEGEDCQLKAHHAPPDKVNARTNARRQAFEKQANGIIFTGCALIENSDRKKLFNNESKQCSAILVCYGKAYQISSNAKSITKQYTIK